MQHLRLCIWGAMAKPIMDDVAQGLCAGLATSINNPATALPL
jgi:hypothetical protein